MKFFVAALCLANTLFSYSLFLINDSPFELTAIVQGANGTHLGEESLQPGEQRQWSADISRTNVKEIYDASSSITPFTVVWKCSYKGYYSISTGIAPGSTVKAHDGQGSKECIPKDKEEKPKCCEPCS